MLRLLPRWTIAKEASLSMNPIMGLQIDQWIYNSFPPCRRRLATAAVYRTERSDQPWRNQERKPARSDRRRSGNGLHGVWYWERPLLFPSDRPIKRGRPESCITEQNAADRLKQCRFVHSLVIKLNIIKQIKPVIDGSGTYEKQIKRCCYCYRYIGFFMYRILENRLDFLLERSSVFIFFIGN